MRICGAILIALACAGIGVNAAWRLYESERLWQAWVRLLTHLQTELRYTLRPVQEVLAGLNKSDYTALEWLSEYDDVSHGLACPQALCEEERTFAQSFFAYAGTSDLEGQLAHLAQCRARADERLEAVTDRRKRLSKAYISTAVCAGISTAIMML